MSEMTPETLVRGELAGLRVRVVESTDPTQVGLAGRVVDETTRTLLVDAGAGVRQIPKAIATFEFATDEAAGGRKAPGTAPEPAGDAAGAAGEDAAYVTVDGELLLSRPALRTEQEVDTTWH